ncbi:MAG: hypothetical protein GF368_03410 [Candidatus Aenigmarchaeota archaeon]|nr:hypothetical protein [Candidatus Aenigmarchaeota archaeon]
MVITENQKKLLERELKEINILYIAGLGVALVIAALFKFLVFSPLSELSMMGIENYLSGFWSWIWSLLLFLMVILTWIKSNRLTQRKREIQFRLAEKVVG